MPARCPAAVDAGIGADRGLDALVAENLFGGFEPTRVGIEYDLRAQMSELMRGEYDTGTPPEIIMISPATAAWFFGAPSTFTNSRLGR